MAPGENKKLTMDVQSTRTEDNLFSDRSDGVSSSAKSDAQPIVMDEYADEPDETLAERLWGLTEMFPESIRNVTYNVTNRTKAGVKSLYSLTRNTVWIFVSSSVILFAPLIFEVERAQMEEIQRSQQKQMLLGPNTAVSGGHGLPMPPIHR